MCPVSDKFLVLMYGKQTAELGLLKAKLKAIQVLLQEKMRMVKL